MKKLLLIVLLLALGAAGGFAWSRGWVDALLATEVSALKTAPDGHPDGSTVRLSGTVDTRIDSPFSDKDLFQLADGTGQVWVLTTSGVPPKGARATVKGTVHRSNTDLGIAQLKGLYVEATTVWIH